jgi:hypothetical protein
MQQTCSRCGGLLVPGASTCNYCGAPVSSSYPQPGTEYGPYSQGSQPTDPYAAQYTQPTASPSAPSFGPPSQPSSFGPPPQQATFSPPAPARKKSPVPLIGVILAIIIVLAGLGVGGYVLFKGTGTTTTGTPTPTPTPVPPLYQANLTSNPGGWDCPGNACSFRSDGYHILSPDNTYDSLLTTQTFDKLVIQVKGIIAQGDPQNAGLAVEFHVPQNAVAAGYGFFLYDDGSYTLVKWDTNGNPTTVIANFKSPAIHSGLNQENDLKLVINGTQFTFYVNGQQVTQGSDSTYPSGYIGLAASGKNTEAIFSDLIVTSPTTNA